MYFGFGDYVPVAQQRKDAQATIAKLQKKGKILDPVEPFNGKIAHSFWGMKWCENLDTYADMEYRAQRGRRYVRTGRVCHLEIAPGLVKAMVNGTRLYNVTINVDPIGERQWESIRALCAKNIGSLVELLQGKIADNIMEFVSKQDNGLFPAPGQIHFSCSCPDFALMCKHVAATLYGIGRRLDTRPDLLFTLWGVDPNDLVQAEIDLPEPEAEMGNLSEIFGIDLDLGEANATVVAETRPLETKPISAKPAAAKAVSAKPTRQKSKTRQKTTAPGKPPFNPERPTGKAIKNLRALARLSQTAMASELGVSLGTIARWEHSASLRLQTRSVKALSELQNRLMTSLE